MGTPPKRKIAIKTCFNINRKLDARQKFAIALYTKDDCFGLVADNQLEMEKWINALLELQHNGCEEDKDAKPKPHFEHVWQVTVKPKGLGSSRKITGQHRLCLTTSSLSLFKMNTHCDHNETLEFPLMSIRRCGHSDCFFFMEVGRSAVTGAGELWMQSEDRIIAQNMHEAILGAMKLSRSKDELGPMSRPRSASTSENSKPISSRRHGGVVSYQVQSMSLERTPGLPSIRKRCDSMPARARTCSEGQRDLISNSPQSGGCYSSPSWALHRGENLRPQSTYARAVSYSPPSIVNIGLTGACSTDSIGSGLSTDECEGSPSDFHFGRYIHPPGELSLHTEPPIKEEMPDDYLLMEPGQEDLVPTETIDVGLSLSNISYTPTIPCTTSNVISPPVSGNHQELASPSPSSIQESYIPMSPGKSFLTDQFLATSRSSSNASEPPVTHVSQLNTPDGYIPMAPQEEISLKNLASNTSGATEEGYLDMEHISSSLPKPNTCGYIEMVSPRRNTQSLQDVTFQNLVTATKQEEFHLDKVKSYFSPSEDDFSDHIKPVRAYSIGSRPQLQKSRLGVHLDQFRVRAFSVGSQATKGMAKRQDTIESELGTLKFMDEKNSKSSSAPLLPSRSQLSAGKGNYCDDLMEMDYSPAPKVEVTPDQEQPDAGKTFKQQQSSSHPSFGTSPTPLLPNSSQQPENKINNVDERAERRRYVCMTYGTKASGNYIEMALNKGYVEMVNSESILPDKDINLASSRKSCDTGYMNMEKKYTENDSKTQKITVNDKILSTSITNQKYTTDIRTDVSSVKSSKEPKSEPTNIYGDYVNLDLSRTNFVASSVSASFVAPKPTSVPEYENIQLGTPTKTPPLSVSPSLSPSVSDYTVMAAVQTLVTERVTVPCPSTNRSLSCSSGVGNRSLPRVGTKNKQTPNGQTRKSLPSRSPQSTIRKQMSAPVAPLALKFDVRKSSCPALHKSPAISPVLAGRSLLAPTSGSPTPPIKSRSPDRSSQSSLSSLVDEGSSGHSSPMPILASSSQLTGAKDRHSLAEATYENISFGPSAGGDCELNYASLDLASTPTELDKTPKSPHAISSSQLLVTEDNEEHPLSYAQIDFTKSEGLRNTSDCLREGRV
ncbi:insulin receptor substrate 1-like isoform X2 [Limulus polyphemus]|uniref:Insulin receptor substrate 1 n=1 Tax=Limulus polyphemus TaxID=6850 RepID=A0ABM1THZ4_LIMPO|nr:insulin receptor substrate 1-like isoform X2 [Limulus polyphemus]